MIVNLCQLGPDTPRDPSLSLLAVLCLYQLGREEVAEAVIRSKTGFNTKQTASISVASRCSVSRQHARGGCGCGAGGGEGTGAPRRIFLVEEPPHNYNLHIKIWHMDRWHGAEPRAVEAAERPMAPKSRLRVRRQQGQLGWPQKMTRNCLTSGGWL